MSLFPPRFLPFNSVGLLLVMAAACGLSRAQVPDTLRYSLYAPKTLPQANEQQGSCVAISGNVAVVGSPLYDRDPVTGLDSGAVKIYDTTNGKLMHRLLNPAGSAFGYFGQSVAISGTKVVVGSCNPVGSTGQAGCAYVYDLSAPNPTEPVVVIENPAPEEQDQFSHSIAIDGDKVVVGAWMADAVSVNAGRVYVFDLSGGEPEEPMLVVENPAPAPEDNFGSAVAIAGSRFAASAYRDNLGAPNAGRVFVYDLESGTPTSPVHSLTFPDAEENDCFGNALAMAGDYLAVGAEADDSSAINAGRVLVYDLGGAEPSQPWLTLTQPVAQPNGYFGTAVALTVDHLVVGAYRDDTAAENAGTCYVYHLSGGTPGTPVGTPDKPLPAVADYFGNAVAMGGNTILVAALHDDRGDIESGCTYVYNLSSPTPDTATFALDNPVSGSIDRFGSSVAVDGNIVAIGSPGSDAGASGAGRVSVHDLSASKPTAVLASLEDPAPDVDENFGAAVAVSGTRVVVGAPGDDDGAEDAGRVYVYDLENLPASEPVQVLLNPAPGIGDRFGSAVAIAGSIVVIGVEADDADGIDCGIAYVYDLASGAPATPVHTIHNPSPAAGDRFGAAVGVSGNRIVIGSPKDDSGASDGGIAYVYDVSGGSPTVPLHVLANPTPQADDGFGNAVGISGNLVGIGASGDDTGAANAGAAYAYDLAGGTPTLPVHTLLNPDPAGEDRFGNAVAVSAPRIVVGAYLDNSPTDSGRSYSFNMASPTPTVPSATQKKSTSTSGDQFGASVAVSGIIVVVGTPSDNKTATDKGAAYVFGPAAPEIAVEVAGADLASGESASFGAVAMGAGNEGEMTISVLNTGITNLSVSALSLAGTNAADFSVVSGSTPPFNIGADDDKALTVSFHPSASGIRNATLLITNSDSDEGVFEIVLSGRGLSVNEDTDADGLNDVSELRMASLGFDWELANPDLVAAFGQYFANGSFHDPAKVQALRVPAPKMTRTSDGQTTLTFGLFKSADFLTYQPLPLTIPEATLNPAGELEFRFNVPDDTEFYRLETK
jgi:hypothetical protein